ncbi:MAG: hypothetical protein P9M15_03045 [Candidatus Electryoneaceae bacterium]|nr:hypothetical protein [Candidatus Electryoneaceae bacterium]
MPTITVTSDEPMVLITVEEYESMKETIEVLSDPELVKDIRDGWNAYEEGRTVSLSKLRQELYSYDGD